MRRELSRTAAEGYDILQVDEATFNPDTYRCAEWARKKEPLHVQTKYYKDKKKVIACCAAISSERGMVHYRTGYRSFDATETVKMLRGIRKAMGPDKKVAILWDNCPIHKAGAVAAAAAMRDVDIRLLRNISYRPDLMGVERVWGLAKKKYRDIVGHYRINCREFDCMSLVEHVMDTLDNELVIKCALHGVKCIVEAQPLMKLEQEQWDPKWPTLLQYKVAHKMHQVELAVSDEERE